MRTLIKGRAEVAQLFQSMGVEPTGKRDPKGNPVYYATGTGHYIVRKKYDSMRELLEFHQECPC